LGCICIGSLLNQNIENERITSLLLSTFEEVENIFKKMRGNAHDEESDESHSVSHDSSGHKEDTSKPDDDFFFTSC